MARAQFQHGVIVVRLDRQHAQRHADVIVVISRADRAGEPRFQHGMDHLPGGRLADAAGDGDHRAGELPPFPGGEIDQRLVGVLDLQRPMVRRRIDRSFGNHAGRAAAKGVADEIRAVLVRSLERPKDIARLDAAAIGHHRADREIGAADQPAAEGQPAGKESIEFAEGVSWEKL